MYSVGIRGLPMHFHSQILLASVLVHSQGSPVAVVAQHG